MDAYTRNDSPATADPHLDRLPANHGPNGDRLHDRALHIHDETGIGCTLTATPTGIACTIGHWIFTTKRRLAARSGTGYSRRNGDCLHDRPLHIHDKTASLATGLIPARCLRQHRSQHGTASLAA